MFVPHFQVLEPTTVYQGNNKLYISISEIITNIILNRPGQLPSIGLSATMYQNPSHPYFLVYVFSGVGTIENLKQQVKVY